MSSPERLIQMKQKATMKPNKNQRRKREKKKHRWLHFQKATRHPPRNGKSHLSVTPHSSIYIYAGCSCLCVHACKPDVFCFFVPFNCMCCAFLAHLALPFTSINSWLAGCDGGQLHYRQSQGHQLMADSCNGWAQQMSKWPPECSPHLLLCSFSRPSLKAEL